MSDGIYAALSGAVAQERALDVVANNVANAGTDGFRGDRLAFRESLSRAAPAPVPSSLRYVEIARSRIDPSEGHIRETGNPLDLALSGDGFFVVRTPNGDRLTRAGSFVVDSAGIVRTREGHMVLSAEPDDPRHPEIVIPPGSPPPSIGEDGTLSIGEQQIARLRLERFASPDDARHEGDTLLVPAPGARTLRTECRVLQGYLEGANVSAIGGMNELITANRSFEAFQRVIQTYRSLDERTARELG